MGPVVDELREKGRCLVPSGERVAVVVSNANLMFPESLLLFISPQLDDTTCWFPSCGFRTCFGGAQKFQIRGHVANSRSAFAAAMLSGDDMA